MAPTLSFPRIRRLLRQARKQFKFLLCHGYFYQISSQSVERWHNAPHDPNYTVIRLVIQPNASGLKWGFKPQELIFEGEPGSWVNGTHPELFIPNHLVTLLDHIHGKAVHQINELQPLLT